MKTFYLFVNGIRTETEDIHTWNREAEAWVEENTDDGVADAYLYHVWAVTRWMSQGSHADKVAQVVKGRALPGTRLVLVGHSNGCDLICRALLKLKGIYVDEVHLVAAATDASFEKNGLNFCLERGRVGTVHVYSDPEDPALKFARDTQWVPFLGYGHLGLEGPKEVTAVADYSSRVKQHVCYGWGHSNYFVGEKFQIMMRAFTTH